MKLPGADCSNCPCRNGVLVPPEINGSSAVIVGEQPGKSEAEDGRPFVGPSGRLADRGLQKGKLLRPLLHITNAVACYTSTKLSTEDYNKAVVCCSTRLTLEVAARNKIIVLGAKALKAFTGLDSAMDWFGYPLPDITTPDREIFPVFHPALALRKPALQDVFTHIMARAALWVRGGLQPWTWPPVHIDQTEEALVALRRIAQAPVVGFDVETAGKNPIFAPLLCVSVASEQEAVSLRWPISSEAHYKALEAVLHSGAVKAAHNSQHDLLSLEANGLAVHAPVFDTLLAHVAQHPQLPHNLSFVCAVEFPAERWKSGYHTESELKGVELWTDANEDMRIYNGRDSLMGAKLAARQIKQLDYRNHVVRSVFDAGTA